MPTSSPEEITRLLLAWREGDKTAEGALYSSVYEELRGLAKLRFRRERPDHTLQATALVHEVYIKLIGNTRIEWQSKAHFLGVAAGVMHNILIDYARSHRAKKRSDGEAKLSLDEAPEIADPRGISVVDLIALNDALASLYKHDPRKAQVAVMRHYGGLSVEETAEVLDVSPRTIKSDWEKAKVWLYRELNKKDE